jgi:hypothetical protein
MMLRSEHLSRLAGTAIFTLLVALPVSGQVGRGAGPALGSIAGTITALGPNGETIKAANVLVQLWTTDSATSAARDAACAAWSSDKLAWLQAKEEIDSPSGMNLSGTQTGRDVEVLRALMALRRDTARSDANGAFVLNSVPYGAYTVEAEVYANDKFVQWSKDAGVIPARQSRVELGAASLAENQYCSTSAAPGDTARIYDTKDLDNPLKSLGRRRGAMDNMPHMAPGKSVTIGFVVNENGFPDMKSVTVTTNGANVPLAAAETAVAAQRFAPPTVHGRPVRVRTALVVTGIMALP